MPKAEKLSRPRQAKYRQMQKMKGLVEVTFWAPEDIPEAAAQFVRAGRFRSKKEAYIAALKLGVQATVVADDACLRWCDHEEALDLQR